MRAFSRALRTSSSVIWLPPVLKIVAKKADNFGFRTANADTFAASVLEGGLEIAAGGVAAAFGTTGSCLSALEGLAPRLHPQPMA